MPDVTKSVNLLQSHCNISIFIKMYVMLNLFGAYMDHPQRVLYRLCYCAKFGYDKCSSFDNMNISIIGAFCWKTPIQFHKIELFCESDPHGGQYHRNSRKAHPCMKPSHLNHQVWKFVQRSDLQVSSQNRVSITIICAQKPLRTDFHQIFYSSRSRGHNHPRQFFGDQLRDVNSVMGLISPIATDQASGCQH